MSVPASRRAVLGGRSEPRVAALPTIDPMARLQAVVAGRSWLVVPFAGAVASRVWSFLLLHVASIVEHRPLFGPNGVTAIWDARWYLGIAANGYHAAPIVENALGGKHDYAFFPLWPALIRVASFIPTHVSIATVAALLSAATFCLAAVLIAAALEPVFGRVVAVEGTLLLAFSPAAFVFSMAYSEALFLALAAAAFLTTSPGRRGLAVALAVAARIAGLPLVAVNGLRWMASRGRDVGSLWVALVGAVTFAGWWLAVGIISGDPLGLLHGSPDWDPVTGAAEVVQVLEQPDPRHLAALIVFAIIAIGGVVALRRSWQMGAFSLLSLALAFLPGGLVSSMPRYALVAFPAFAGLASIAGRRGTIVLTIAAAIAQIAFVSFSFPAPGHGLAP